MFNLMKNLVAAPKTSKQTAAKNRPGLQVERLESREVPASIAGGNLMIFGTAGNDNVTVSNYNGVWLKVTENGNAQFFNKAQINSGNIIFLGGNGNDAFMNVTHFTTVAHGGLGNDTIYGGSGNDYLFGEGNNDALYGMEGNDVLDGGDGQDFLDGFTGNDTLYGRADYDRLHGGAGDDILDAGSANEFVNYGSGYDWDKQLSKSDQISQFMGNKIAAFAQANLGKTVKHQPMYFGNEQCTDLVLAALKNAGAKTTDDFGVSGTNADYVWGNLALKRTVVNKTVTSSTGQWSDIRTGDIIQYRNVTIVTTTANGSSTSTASQHSAIIKTNHGNGLITVLEQNSGGRHYVTEKTINLANMQNGTVWVYHPVAK